MKNDTGSILIVTLWIVAVLSLLAYGLTNQVRLLIRQERWSQDETFSHEMLLSLSELALSRLRQDADLEVDSFQESWAKPYRSTSEDLESEFESASTTDEPFEVSLLAVDECGKINVNLASEEVLIEALRETGWEVNAAAVAKAIIDWRDPDRDGAAEGEQIASGDRRYMPANMDLTHVEELLFVEGVLPAVFFGEDANRNGRLDPEEDDENIFDPPDNGDGRLQPGLIDLFTTYGTGVININGAPESVIRAVIRAVRPPTEAIQLARSVVRKRQGADGADGTSDDQPFTSEDAIIEALGEDIYLALLRAGVELGIRTDAVRYLLNVSLSERHHTLEGELVILREDGALIVREWHAS